MALVNGYTDEPDPDADTRRCWFCQNGLNPEDVCPECLDALPKPEEGEDDEAE